MTCHTYYVAPTVLTNMLLICNGPTPWTAHAYRGVAAVTHFFRKPPFLKKIGACERWHDRRSPQALRLPVLRPQRPGGAYIGYNIAR